ncbi:hypothetical protein BE11_01745 [Sorangium cellulosum]|nr:hypothetical protein BE11_01745 [Sorangium cellulosum]
MQSGAATLTNELGPRTECRRSSISRLSGLAVVSFWAGQSASICADRERATASGWSQSITSRRRKWCGAL